MLRIGATTLTLGGGKNYDGGTDEDCSWFIPSYFSRFSSGDMNYLKIIIYIQQISFLWDLVIILKRQFNHSQTKLISVAEIRKDSIAFISPHRGAFLSDGSAGTVTVFNDSQITENVISFLCSSIILIFRSVR